MKSSILNRIRYHFESELRDRGRQILEGLPVAPDALEEFLTESNEAGQASLAKYVVHRRRVLTLLKKSLQRNSAGAYSLEEVVHKIIFPLRTTSEDVPYEQMNLWMIDERLAYHSYLASDKQLASLEPVVIDSRERPDIIVFNSPFAFPTGIPIRRS